MVDYCVACGKPNDQTGDSICKTCMSRRFMSVYVTSAKDAKAVVKALKKLKKTIKSLDWDGSWEWANQ